MKAGKGKRIKTLNLAAITLVAAALLFSLYCIANTTWGDNGASQPSAKSSKRVLLVGGKGEEQHITSDTPAPEQQPAAVSQQPCTKSITVISTVNNIHNPRRYHTVTTTFGFANHWQARIHYYWFKRQRDLCEAQGLCDMGGFTRLLHSGEADDLMDEIPTVVVDKLPDSAMKGTGYVVLNRPYAFIQWLLHASIPERYILMGEADHLFLRPMPNLMVGEGQAAFFFSYIVPEQYGDIVRKFLGPISDDELKLVPRIGNSPTFVSVSEFRATAPAWFNVTMAIFDDKQAHDAWSWVLEMYGYALATFKLGQHRGMTTYTEMLAHPPFDKTELDHKGDPFYLLHLTYPLKYTAAGNFTDKDDFVWKFDKRAFMDSPPPRNLADPPANIDNQLARIIIRMINEATNNIPCWDAYVQKKLVTTVC